MEHAGIDFAQMLVHGVIEYQDDMDRLITRFAPEWPLDQMAVIDRNILRIAMYEFLVTDETPVKVAINEAVELAKVYGSDSAPRFINGVLGTLADHLDELQREVRRGPMVAVAAG
jgi:transcription antitermination protein NusB